jgi:peroxiredoxin
LATKRKLFDDTYDTVTVAIKPEPLAIVSTFKDPMTMDIPLLADPGSSVHEAYGIVGIYHFHRRDMYFPATLLIDKKGKLRWLYVGKRNSDRPVVEEIILKLEKLGAE